tara:strand:- start:2804 stop:3043 length:240 start_codon:yes stop_codon:yes gene_type:complete
MKTIFNLFCIVTAFTLGFNAQGPVRQNETDYRLELSQGPADQLICLGHCDHVQDLNETDRRAFLEKVRERVASYKTIRE